METILWKYSVFIFYIFIEISSGQEQGPPDNFGVEFVVTFVDILHVDSQGPTDPEVYIATLSNHQVDVLVTAPLWDATWNVSTSVIRGTNQIVAIPESARNVNTGFFTGTFIIHATGPVSVQAINKEPYNMDGFTLYPTDVLGTTYFAMTGVVPCIQAIGINEETTTITIQPTSTVTWQGTNYPPGSSFDVELEQYQTWQYCHMYFDSVTLTGTRMTGDRPFAAFSGSYFTNIADNTGTVDHLMNQLSPIEQMGRRFALVGAPVRNNGDIFRVMGTIDGTQYSINGGNPVTIGNGESHELDIASDVYKTLESDQPISVFHFAKSYDPNIEPATGGDPSLAYLPPLEQWANQHLYSTMNGHPYSGDFTHYGVIIIKDEYKDGIRWNDSPLSSDLTWSSLPQWDLVTAEIPVPDGVHDFYHTDPTVGFVLMEFGFVPYGSYGTVAGSRASPINTDCEVTNTTEGDGIDNDCDDWIDEELPDGIDNDNDGLIDEDLANAVRVDGGWGNWTHWSDCWCGTQMEANQTSRNRSCDNPEPIGYGAPCAGPDTESDICNCTGVVESTTTTAVITTTVGDTTTTISTSESTSPTTTTAGTTTTTTKYTTTKPPTTTTSKSPSTTMRRRTEAHNVSTVTASVPETSKAPVIGESSDGERRDPAAIALGTILLALLAAAVVILIYCLAKRFKRKKKVEKPPAPEPEVVAKIDATTLTKPNGLPPVIGAPVTAPLIGMRLQREATRLPAITRAKTKIAWNNSGGV